MRFDFHFFNLVLADWDYKAVYVNDKCIYCVDSDVETTIAEFNEKLMKLEELTSIVWKSINILPYDSSGGVTIKIELEVSFW